MTFMAGPVWQFDAKREGICDSCLRRCTGMFVEGEVADNQLEAVRVVCPDCISSVKELIVSGEIGGEAKAPAYAHDR
jgi:hypothetical protein